MSETARRGMFVRMFGSAVIIQALLSATNFFVGLMLIRRTSDLQYGYYVLVNNGILFTSGFINAFIQPPLVLLTSQADRDTRANLIGGLYREQRTLLRWGGSVLFAIVTILWLTRVLSPDMAALAIAAVTLVLVTLYKESFRMVLFIFRRSYDVLWADVCYVVIVVSLVPFATLMRAPAAMVVFVLAAAGAASALAASRLLWRHEPWDAHGMTGVLRRLAPVGGWSAAGSTTHWAFSQGYNYVVAAALDVPAVAALAATRLLMMPVNLLSSGIISLMMPTAAAWLTSHGPAAVFRRLCVTAVGLAAFTVCYFSILWIGREWIFTHVIHKSFLNRDQLLLVWFAVFLVMVFRDQLQYLPGVNALYRPLTGLTAASAVVSLAVGYFMMLHTGVIGASLGVLLGELLNLSGIIFLSIRCIRNSRNAPVSTAEAA